MWFSDLSSGALMQWVFKKTLPRIYPSSSFNPIHQDIRQFPEVPDLNIDFKEKAS